jgi:hypothetical protein
MNKGNGFSKIWYLVLLLVTFVAGCGGHSAESPKAVTAYSFAGVAGTINEPAKTVSLTLPYGTAVTALVATFTTTGTSIKVGTVPQTSNVTANDFTGPLAYTITGEDGTTATYSVIVTIAPNSAKALTAYSFLGFAGFAATIDEPAKSIALTLPFGTDLTNLVATFTGTGTEVKVGSTVQTSAATTNNFAGPVAYQVTAADGTTATYTVTVNLAQNPAKAITAYWFVGFTGFAATINEPAKTIALTLPFGTNVTSLVATFTTTGAGVKVGSAAQTSAATTNNFAGPVAYQVTAADGTTATYTVTVNLAPNPAKAITAYSFLGFTGFAATINEPAKTIALTLPFGTDVSKLVATFTTTGTVIKVGSTVQTSTATTNTFSGPVAYLVTAADGTTATYTVTVNLAPNPAKAITAYSFLGFTGFAATINEPAKTIALTVPFGTNVTSLVATFTTTGAGVTIGGAVQTSAATANNFAAPVAYLVTAADGTTATYTVRLTIAPNPAKALSAFSFVGFPGFAATINEPAKSLALTLPFGTDLTHLVASFTTTGTGVNVGSTVQTSTATANNFTGPVAYLVTAADNSTVTYTVTVTIAPNPAKAVTAFSFLGFTGFAATINEPAKTIALTLPFGTKVTNLVATFTTTGAGVTIGGAVQTSAATTIDFTGPVAYQVTAADGTTATYTVTVTLAPSPAKAITAYSFLGFTGFAAAINEPAKSIALTLPFGTDPTNLVATFTTTGTGVKVGSTVQTSTATANNFTAPVAYLVTAADNSTVTYTATVTIAPNPAKALTAFSFAGFPGVAATITDAAKTIAVTLPFGTNVTNLAATFTTTGSGVTIGATVQTSTATTNDFTNPVLYTVTAADASTVTYTVTVTVAPASAKAITTFSLKGAAATINEATKAIAVTVPFGSDLTNLVATYTTTGTVVKIGPVAQASGITANDFTSAVTYKVTAGDLSTSTYSVTVTLSTTKGPAPVNLGTAGNFVILAKSGVSTTGTTKVVGDIGISPAAASFITGFSLIADSTNNFATSFLVTGKLYASDYAPPTPAVMTTAISDMQIAYNDAAGRTTPDFTELGAGNISGLTLVPGLYKWGTGVLLTNTGVTLSGGANDIWIFQVAGNLTVNNSSIVTLAGGAQAKNVFWQVAGQATLGTAADFKGIILSQTLISLNTGAKMNGRALAQTAVTLNATAITAP